MRTKILVGLTGIGLVATLLGCGGDDDDTAEPVEETNESESTTTSAADESTSTTFQDDTQAAIDAYNKAWEAVYAAMNPPNVQHPALGEYLTGPAKQGAIDIILKTQQDHQYIVDGRVETHPEPVSETPDLVVLSDCTVAYGTTYSSDTGEVIGSGPHTPNKRRVEITKIDDRWFVSSLTNPEGEQCTPED